MREDSVSGAGERLRLDGYLRLLVGLTLAAVAGLWLLGLQGHAAWASWPDAVALAVLTLLAGFGLDEEPTDAVEIGTAAGFVVLGPIPAVGMAAVLSPLVDLGKRVHRMRMAYHFGRRVLPAVVAAAAYLYAVPSPRSVELARNAAGYLLVGAVWSLVALAVRARYFAALAGVPLVRSLRVHTRPGLAPLVVSLPLGIAVASLFEQQPAAVVVLLLPALLGRRLTPSARFTAETDPLTGFDLPHRLWERLHQEMLRAQRQKQPLSVLVLVLENLEELRRVLGGAGAGTVVQEVARAVQRELRRSDYVAHLSEDRLVCLLPGATADQAERVAARIRSEVVMRTPARVSFGLSAYTGGPEEPSAILNAADAAADRARRSGERLVRG
ncbi:MAG: GGDEF domain-containing protein [Armatimonadota bacterium]|nr:GGDEF domain-containing protein [Armatimonadota bacterium]MDW8155879.1 GGDEF domain-containing protein [Armatimonadota bacterium]